MNSVTASRRSKLGLAGLASLCCLGSGTAAVAGGSLAAVVGATLLQVLVIAVTLGVAGLVLTRLNGCTRCP